MNPLDNLIGELSKLPSIGNKSATRIAHYLMKSELFDVKRLSDAIIEIKKQLSYCSVCYSITNSDPCSICSDLSRDRNLLCVVEEPFNVAPIENTGEYKGIYHVLLGRLSPQRGVGPEKLTIPALLKRAKSFKEIIIATNPNVEGEATALYLSRLLNFDDLKITRIAFGIPVGGDLEYIDEATLGRSISGRVVF